MPESSVAVAQQNVDASGKRIRNREVQFAIAIQVRHCYRLRVRTNVVAFARREGSIAVAQQYVGLIGRAELADRYQIQLPVAIKIAKTDGHGRHRGDRDKGAALEMWRPVFHCLKAR